MSGKTRKVLAVDLGASSGRGIIGEFDGGRLTLREIHRFPNEPLPPSAGGAGHLRWNASALRREVEKAVEAGASEGAESAGIDTWGVDYGLLDGRGELIADPVHYRDGRTAGIPAAFGARMSHPGRLYEITGIQSLDFNTVYQLAAEFPGGYRKTEGTGPSKILFMPDLFGYFLTGEQACEYTIASTGALLDARTRDFSPEVLGALGIGREMFAPLVQPGNLLGRARGERFRGIRIINVASHDTASAVLSVPTDRAAGEFLYISSGTWSLLGTELRAPLITRESEKENWTNEGGAGGTVRFLKNIMGLWLLQESRRAFAAAGFDTSFDSLSAAAAEAPPFGSLIDPDAPVFSPPGDMPSRIASFCARTGQRVPRTPGETVRVIFDSLAMRYRYTANAAASLCGTQPGAINIVGGGSKDETLCRLTADVTGMSVIAGPSEATAVGNILMQLTALGEIGGISEAREVVRRSFGVKTYLPSKGEGYGDEAFDRFRKLAEGGRDAAAEESNGR